MLERRFQHPGNPVLTFCFASAMSITDASGNSQMDKIATRVGRSIVAVCAGGGRFGVAATSPRGT